MYAVIVGGGKAGANVARALLRLGHEVTIVEVRPSRLATLEAEFEHMRVRQVRAGDPFQDQVEEGEPRGGGHEAIGPALDEGGVVEFVLGSDEVVHGWFRNALWLIQATIPRHSTCVVQAGAGFPLALR